MTNIAKIEKWLNKNGWTLNWSQKSEADSDGNVVNIHPLLGRKYKLYTLLHETGHVIVYKDNFLKNFKDVNIGDNVDERHSKSLIFRYKKIIEEISAWESGYKLALQLKIRISKRAYDKYAATCVHSYIRCVADTNIG